MTMPTPVALGRTNKKRRRMGIAGAGAAADVGASHGGNLMRYKLLGRSGVRVSELCNADLSDLGQRVGASHLDRVRRTALGEQPLPLGLTDPELLGDVGRGVGLIR